MMLRPDRRPEKDRVNGPCPDCGRESLQIVYFTTPENKHQHTWYVCTNWPLRSAGGERCGWTGFSVPGWDKVSTPDDTVTTRLLVNRTQTMEVDVDHEPGVRAYQVEAMAIAKASAAGADEWDDGDWDVVWRTVR